MAWAATLYRLRDLRKDWGNPALRALCAALALPALTLTLTIPSVSLLVGRVLGVPNIAWLWTHCCLVMFSATVQRLLLFWAYPPEQARPKARRRMLGCVLAMPLMVTLFLLAPVDEPTTTFSATYADAPYVAQYLMVYLTASAVALADVTRLCWRYAKIAGRPWLRRGLRITVAGAASGFAFCGCKAVLIAGRRLGLDLDYLDKATPVFASGAALLIVVGLTIPAWGPRLAEARDWVAGYRSYRRLHPLWFALYQATPQIALVPPASAGADTFVVRDLDFRLYRRVIEIRDGRLALRPYLDREVAAAAHRLGEAAGLAGEELQAVMEASALAAALRAKAQNRPVVVDHRDPTGGADLPSEIAWLVRVARAFAGSPVVTAALAETERTASPATGRSNP